MRRTELRLNILLLLVAAFMALLLAAAACGGDGGSGDGATDTPTASDGGTETPNGRTPAPTARPNASSLEELSAKYLQGVDGKIKYDYVSNFGQHPHGELTVYRLEDKDREDWISAPEGIQATTVIIRSSGPDYVCSATDFTSSCIDSPEQDFVAIDTFFSPIREVPIAIVAGLDDATVTELGASTYAGTMADCFQVEVPRRLGTGPTGTESIKLCYTADGALLYEQRIVNFADSSFPQAKLTLEAQEIGEVAAANFDPPYSVSN